MRPKGLFLSTRLLVIRKGLDGTMSFLLVERGPEQGRRIPLIHFPVTIGRDPSNDIALSDEEVSRFHVRIKQRGRLTVIEDLDSRNGTYLNGDRVLNSIIKSADKILIGNTELVFFTAESDIQIASEIVNFDMLVAEQLGLNGPIDVDTRIRKRNFKPVRLNHQNMLHHLSSNMQAVKNIYDLHGNILVIDDLEEACNAFLKSIGKVMPSVSRGSLFIWIDATRQLIPMATRQFKKKTPFLLSHRAFEDVIARKQGILLHDKSPEVTQDGRNRAVLPMLHNENIIGILHLECDSPKNAFPMQELEMAQSMLTRCAPSFESMLLRRDLDTTMVSMIETLIATIEAKDTYTRGHSERVSRYCMAIADELKLNREVKRLLMISSLCHDIGKIGVPDAILKKASLLTAEEYEEMKLHPSIGAEIISHMPNAQRFLSGIKHHHEKWDGTGYPDALAGEDIPFFGRIVGLADVFDAMVSGRSYSGFMEQAEAVERLHQEKELFDPEIFKTFVRAFENGTLTLKTSTQNQIDPKEILENKIDLSALKSSKKRKVKKKT